MTLATAVAVASVAAACGQSSTGEVRAKVEQFAAAVHDHAYRVLCTQVLGPRLLADIAAGGITCPHALALGLAKVADAKLTVGTITVAGQRASVLTLSQARGERTAVARLELTRTGAGWRIDSLGNAA